MAKRKDGRQTKQKLLDAACTVFSERGFRDAKVKEICRRAGTNTAAANYHFGDKESLYVAALRRIVERFDAGHKIPPRTLSPEERLRVAIQQIFRSILMDESDNGSFRRIEAMELANPTRLIDDFLKEVIAARKKEMEEIVRGVAGPSVSGETVDLCMMSIVNQCRGYLQLLKVGLVPIDGEPLTPLRAEQVAEHIARFSIAGIKAFDGGTFSGDC